MDNIKVWNANMLKDLKKLNNKIQIYDRWLDRYIGYIKSSKLPIIDLGCGIGNDTLYIKQHGKEVISVDYSDEALRVIRDNIKDSKTLQMDFEKEWLFEEKSADLIIANLSLHYFDSETTFKIIKNIKDTLVDEGILLVRLNTIEDTNYGSSDINEIEKHYYETMDIKKRFFDREDVKYFFASFEMLKCEEVTILTLVHDKPKKVWECVFRKKG